MTRSVEHAPEADDRGSAGAYEYVRQCPWAPR